MGASLKWRIQIWHALILGLVLCVLGTGFYFYEKNRQILELDRWLDQQIPPLVGSPPGKRPPPGVGTRGPGPSEEPPEASGSPASGGWESVRDELPTIVGKRVAIPRRYGSLRERFEEHYAPLGFYAIVYDGFGNGIEFQTRNAPKVELELGSDPGYYVRYREGRYREIVHPNPMHTILVGADLSQFQASLTRLKFQIAGVSLVIFAFGLGVGYFLVSRSLLPLKAIENTSARIADGHLKERIPESKKGRANELEVLAGHLNRTFAQLESLFQRQIRFTADASHELRTPLTALLAQIEHGRNRPRTNEELTHVLDICARSANRIRRITEQLIELSRYDSRRVTLDYEDLPLDGFLLSLAEELEPYVSEKAGTLKTDVGTGVIRCDPFRLHQVILNLVNNAMQHNDRPITISLCARNENRGTVIQIIDDGKGIQPENLDKLFNRFFQESASRAKDRDRANVGLGLSISQAIVEAHGGTLKVESIPEEKTIFTITLPTPSRKRNASHGGSI